MVLRGKSATRVLAFLFVIVLIAGYVDYKQVEYNRQMIDDEGVEAGLTQTSLTDTDFLAAVAGKGADFFVDYRLERERVRSQQLDLLREIINNPKADDAARKEASNRWLQFTADLSRELEMESLMKAKGFSDAVVFLQPSSAVVIVKAATLTQAEVAQVADIVQKTTGLRAEQINILAKPK